MKFPNFYIVWTEGKNLSLPDLLSHSLTTAKQDEHCLRTVEIPDSIKFIMARNQNTQPIQCHYAVSKEYINLVSTNTHVKSPHFPISLQIIFSKYNQKMIFTSQYHTMNLKPKHNLWKISINKKYDPKISQPQKTTLSSNTQMSH